MKQYSIASKIYRQTIENQGCTMNLRGLSPDNGFMVGLHGYELRINVLNFTSAHVDHFIRKHLSKLYEDNVYIGTWISGDEVFIDLSVNLKNKAIALAYGKLQGQVCIWDIEKSIEIYQLSELEPSIN